MNLKQLKNIEIYGDVKYRNKNCPTESQEQMTFFSHIRTQYPTTYGKIAFHQRNESKRNYRQAQYQKAEGLTTGVADIIIPGAPTFICELKRQDHTLSKISSKQIQFLEAAQRVDSFVCVALGYKAAIDSFENYLEKYL